MSRFLLGLALAAAALSSAAPTAAHTTTASWSAFDTEQRLTIGRFAAGNGIENATCLGMGAAVNPKASAFSRRYKHLECTVYDKNFDKRQLVVHVRTATTFTPQWLTTKEC